MSSHRERLTPLIEEALAVADQIPEGPITQLFISLSGQTKIAFSIDRVDTADDLMRTLVGLWGVPSHETPLNMAVWQVGGVGVEAWWAGRYFEAASPAPVPAPVFRIPEAVTA